MCNWVWSFLNLEIKAERGGRTERLSLYMKVTCCKEPCKEVHSHRVTNERGEERKESSLQTSLTHFLSVNETQRDGISHKKLIYLTEKAKSWPLLSMGCHRTPR